MTTLLRSLCTGTALGALASRPFARYAGFAAILLAVLAPVDAEAISLNPGDLVVADGDAFGGGGGLIHVDPKTGAQTVISSGGFFSHPTGIAIDAAGRLIVTDQDAFGGGGGIIRVDPSTGSQTLVSFGGTFLNPAGIVIDAGGQFLVTDFTVAAVVRVDPISGTQTVVSAGGLFVHPFGLTIDAVGDLIVADAGGSTSGSCVNCGLIRVDPLTGAQTLISAGGFFATPSGVVIDAAGDLIVADVHGFAGPGGLIRVDPLTGDQSVITSGGLFSDSALITIDAAGQVIVANRNSATGVIGIDPLTGAQTPISSGGFFTGQVGTSEPLGVAVVPEPPNQPPDCSGAVAKPSVVWKRNHKTVKIVIEGVVDPDGDRVTVTPTAVFQDEKVRKLPDAALEPLAVRAERNGKGNGRVYTISFAASDGKAGTCQGLVRVCVPHDRRSGGTCVDEGPAYNSLMPSTSVR